MTESAFAGIERAIADVAAGRPVVVVDDEDRENEGDLIFAAAWATPEVLAFTIRYTSGYVCVALTGENCDRLDLPLGPTTDVPHQPGQTGSGQLLPRPEAPTITLTQLGHYQVLLGVSTGPRSG